MNCKTDNKTYIKCRDCYTALDHIIDFPFPKYATQIVISNLLLLLFIVVN